MKFFVIFAVALVGAVNAGYIASGGHGGHSGSSHGATYAASSGLRTIAQGSADQANSAVAQQHVAAHQAIYVAKSTLAQSAAQYAGTANAALAGKYALLQALEQFVAVLEEILGSDAGQADQSQQAVALSAAAVQKAQEHLASVNKAFISAQAVFDQAEQAASAAKAELASQTAMVEKAKARLHALQSQLDTVRIDFAATQQAAEKANLAAQAAQNNAAAAGSHASHELDKISSGGASVNAIDEEEYAHIIDVKSKYSH